MDVRTYGGWRERRGFGVAGMDGKRTAAALGGLTLTVLVSMFSERALLVMLPLLAATGALVLGSVRGEPVMDVIGRHVAWWRASRRGWTSHRAGRGRPSGSEWTLPGPLAGSALLAPRDEHGQPWCCVWDRRTGRLTAVLVVAAASPQLVEREQADAWVANWHAQLAKLGYAPMVRHLAVTVETTPAPAGALDGHVGPRLDPAAPPTALRLMEDLLTAAPASAASVATRVALTIDPAASAVRLETLDEQVAEFSRLLTGFASSLGACGVTVLRRARASDVVGWVRAAFDPAAAPALAAAAPHDLAWADAAPVAAEERWDSYRCDSGVSVSWGWDEAPRSAVSSDVLTRLIAPGGWPKRVTLLITPMPAARAARELQLQSQAALFRSQVKVRSGREESAREWADRERAMQAAAEEAQGAGVVDIQVYVTTTVGDESLLAAACADVEHRAEESRLRLRRLFGSQSVGFAAGLSCGIKPELLRGR